MAEEVDPDEPKWTKLEVWGFVYGGLALSAVFVLAPRFDAFLGALSDATGMPAAEALEVYAVVAAAYHIIWAIVLGVWLAAAERRPD